MTKLPKSFEDIDEIHGQIQPESFGPGDSVRAKIAHHGKGKFRDVRVQRLSPLGIELLQEGTQEEFAPFDRVDLKIHLGSHLVEHEGLIVSRVVADKQSLQIAIRWTIPKEDPIPGGETQRHQRWLCGHEYLPTGVLVNPLRFNDFVHYRVIDLSSGGMLIKTSLRNNILVPKMVCEGMISFPLVGQTNAEFEIVYARIGRDGGKDYLLLGCQFLNPSRNLKELIAQYLIQFGPTVSPEDLKRDHLQVKSLNTALTFSTVRNEEEYKEVLELRRIAWAHRNKSLEVSKPEDFADGYDTRARIFIARYKGNIIGSFRIVFPEENEKLEHEQYRDLPELRAKASELVEITRVVTHPEYRGVDLLYLLFKHAALACLQAKKKYILGSSEQHLLSLYQKVGFKVLPDRVSIPHYKVEASLILVDVPSVVAGIGVGPFAWNLMYSDLVHFLTRGELVKFGTKTNFRIASYRLLQPVARLLLKTHTQKR